MILDGIRNAEIRGQDVKKKVVMYDNILDAWSSKCCGPLKALTWKCVLYRPKLPKAPTIVKKGKKC